MTTGNSSSNGTGAPASSTIKGVGDGLLEGLPFSVGSIIAGKYRVDRVIGAGGMGVILAGHHVALDQRVAIKVLRPDAIGNAEYVARFTREARASARLRSEHVARVLDVGQSEDGLPYMVMEYLSGKDLSRIVRERGPLPILDAAEYVMQACEGLAEAHRAGIVHRDLKPANLFLTKATDGSALVKVLDFGISKLLARPEDTAPTEGLTQTQAMIGSPHYMSPEQLRSARDVDARTDIWSLGGVLFKLLTNQAAFEGASTPELCVAILVGSPRTLRKLRPEVPAELEQVVLKCLQKDPSARFASVGELAGALAAFAPSHSASSVERIVRVGASADPRETTSDAPPAPAAPARALPAPEPPQPTVLVPVQFEMTTMTASAASMSTAGSSDSVLASRVRPSRTLPIVAASLAVLLLVAGVAMIAASMGRRNSDAAAAAATGMRDQQPPAAMPIPPPAEPAEAPVVAARTAAAPPATAAPPEPVATTHVASVAPPPRQAPRGTTTPPTAPAKTTTAVATAKPTATVTPPPQPTHAATSSGMPDFGGRK